NTHGPHGSQLTGCVAPCRRNGLGDSARDGIGSAGMVRSLGPGVGTDGSPGGRRRTLLGGAAAAAAAVAGAPAGAEFRDDADLAPWPLRLADEPAVPDQEVLGIAPELTGQDLHEIAFDPDRVGLAREAEAPGEALDVRVDDDAFRLAERVAQDDVRGLAADAREADQRVHLRRDLAPVLVDQRVRHRDQVPRLAPEEAGRVDELFDLLLLRAGQVLWCRVPREEGGRDLVDPLVGALRREDRGDEELERVLVVERALGVRILRREAVQDPGRPLPLRTLPFPAADGPLRLRRHPCLLLWKNRATSSSGHAFTTSSAVSHPFRATVTPYATSS